MRRTVSICLSAMLFLFILGLVAAASPRKLDRDRVTTLEKEAHGAFRRGGKEAMEEVLARYGFYRVNGLDMYVATVTLHVFDGILVRVLPIAFVYMVWRGVKALEGQHKDRQ